ncbi:TVP38/TMEM64 family protein [Microcella sp.]|uniref:TVP38/TMEM64 family protein n=1 Tax=Microcella sp. TaxID=1913979 RepID=UPI0039191DBF
MTDAPGSDTGGGPDRVRRTAVIVRAIALVVFVAAGVAVWLLVPLPPVDEVRAGVQQLGWGGAIVTIVLYAAITLTPAPKNVLSIAAGLVFGFGLALVLVYLGALLGAAIAFVLGRALGREAVERFTGARVARLDALLQRRGLATVIGLRLIPVIPFTAINYGAGLTAVRRRDYALGTALGIIPGTAAYVALGAFGLELQWPAWLAIGLLGALTIAGAILGERGRRIRRDAAAAAPPTAPLTES